MSRRRPLPPDLAGRPFTVREGAVAGVSAKRMRASDLHRPHRGVRAPAPPASALDACRALVLRLPADAFFTGPTAAALRDLPLPRRLEHPAPLHVAVPGAHRAPRIAGVVAQQVLLQHGDVVRHLGLPLASPERMWLDLARVLDLTELVVVGDALVAGADPLTTIPRLRRALAAFPGRRGRIVLRRALELLDAASESPMESRLRVLLVLAGVTGFVSNLPVVHGGRRYRIDIAFPESKVALEYHGEHHGAFEQWRRDVHRNSVLREAGWVVIEITKDDLHDADALVRRIRAALRAARRDTAR